MPCQNNITHTTQWDQNSSMVSPLCLTRWVLRFAVLVLVTQYNCCTELTQSFQTSALIWQDFTLDFCQYWYKSVHSVTGSSPPHNKSWAFMIQLHFFSFNEPWHVCRHTGGGTVVDDEALQRKPRWGQSSILRFSVEFSNVAYSTPPWSCSSFYCQIHVLIHLSCVSRHWTCFPDTDWPKRRRGGDVHCLKHNFLEHEEGTEICLGLY